MAGEPAEDFARPISSRWQPDLSGEVHQRLLRYLVDLSVDEGQVADLGPNRKVVTKGGSLLGDIQMEKLYSETQNIVYLLCF